jgi:hypothetical protein
MRTLRQGPFVADENFADVTRNADLGANQDYEVFRKKKITPSKMLAKSSPTLCRRQNRKGMGHPNAFGI